MLTPAINKRSLISLSKHLPGPVNSLSLTHLQIVTGVRVRIAGGGGGSSQYLIYTLIKRKHNYRVLHVYRWHAREPVPRLTISYPIYEIQLRPRARRSNELAAFTRSLLSVAREKKTINRYMKNSQSSARAPLYTAHFAGITGTKRLIYSLLREIQSRRAPPRARSFARVSSFSRAFCNSGRA